MSQTTLDKAEREAQYEAPIRLTMLQNKHSMPLEPIMRNKLIKLYAELLKHQKISLATMSQEEAYEQIYKNTCQFREKSQKLIGIEKSVILFGSNS